MQAGNMGYPRSLQPLVQSSCKNGLFWKDGTVTFLYSVLMFGTPELLSLSILHCQGKPYGRLTDCQHAVANVDTPYIFSCFKHAHFMTNGPWRGYTVLQGWSQHKSVLSSVNHGWASRSCMSFSMIFCCPLLPYSHDNWWMLTSARGDIIEW